MESLAETIFYLTVGGGGGFVLGYYLRDLDVSRTLKFIEKLIKQRKVFDDKFYDELKLYLESADAVLNKKYNKLMVFSKKPARQLKNTIEDIINGHYTAK